LLESLATALSGPGRDELGPVESLGPLPVAQAVLRRVAQLGDGAGPLTRALAVLGGPAPLRHAAALAGQDIPRAARLADRLRAAQVLAPGAVLEFAHPIVADGHLRVDTSQRAGAGPRRGGAAART
jgi:hypothetical protein